MKRRPGAPATSGDREAGHRRGRDESTDALASLHREYSRALLAFFERRGCAAAVAEDLTQDVFVRVLAYRSRAPILNPAAFLFHAAGNLLRDRIRTDRRWQFCPVETIDAGKARQPLVDPITPERILGDRQSLAVVSQAIEELDPRTRRIFLMARLDETRRLDIATGLGLSVSLVEKTVRSAHRHVVARLDRQVLRQWDRTAETAGPRLSAVA